jgi:CubicO group peptidase (beta-lactamase class C family)
MGSLQDRASLRRRVDLAIEQSLAKQRIVGTVVFIASDGDVIHRVAAGSDDREAGRPMRQDAIFRLASITKSITTAAAMALIEQGRLSLDDTVTRWIPEFRPKLPLGGEAVITVRHLLTHTAGLSYGLFQAADGPYRRTGVSDGLDQPGLTMIEELSRLASVPLFHTPGSAWSYSLAIDVLGEILARIEGRPLPEVVERLVTGPLGMTDTAFGVRDPGRLAVPYVDGPPPRRMKDPDLVSPIGAGSGIRFAPSRMFDPLSFPSGGGGMNGTAADILTFLETLRKGGGAILRPETVRAMMTNQIGALRIDIEPTPAWGFGFGGAVLMDPELAEVPQAKGTWKWGGVYGHHWYVDPENRLSVVALTNTALEGMAGGFVTKLMYAVYGAD